MRSVDTSVKKGMTALHKALLHKYDQTKKGVRDVIQFLALDGRTLVNQVDGDGTTPLMQAVYCFGSPEMIRFLAAVPHVNHKAVSYTHLTLPTILLV